MSREARSSRLSTWPGGQHLDTLKGCFHASWDEMLTTFPWQMPPCPPCLESMIDRMSWQVGLERDGGVCTRGRGTHLPRPQQRVGLLHCAAALRVEGLGGQYVTLFVEGGTLWRQTPSISAGYRLPDWHARPLSKGKGTLMEKEETMDHAQRVTGLKRSGEGCPRGLPGGRAEVEPA